MVEHLKVRVYLLGGGLMVEPACASLTVEHLKVMAALTVEHANASSDGGPLLNSRAPKGPYGRAPKGPYQSST